MSEQERSEVPGVFAVTYGVELLCHTAPEIGRTELLASLRRWCPGAEPLGREPDSPLAFVHPNHRARLVDGMVPAATVIGPSVKPVDVERFRSALHQKWNFPEAEVALRRCTASVLVTDMMSSTLEYRERLDLFHAALRATLGVVECEVIAWHASDRLVSPSAWVSAYDDQPQRFFAGAVNVRLFNIAGADHEGDVLMDTLGHGALGLPDLQCHFRALDPDDVARVLYNIAWYVYSEGDVIADGNTVEGITPGSRWRCQHEHALVPPNRVVLDLDPGPPNAAGNRAWR